MTDFIEVADVLVEITQPDASTVTFNVGRVQIDETGAREMSVLRATLPDFDETKANKVRSGRRVRVLAKAAGEVNYRVPFAGIITDANPSADDVDTFEVVAHDYWKRLKRHRVTFTRYNIDAGDAVLLVLQGQSDVVGTAVDAPFGVTLDRVAFDYATAMDAIHLIADRADADFYIDEDRVLHFFPRGGTASGLSITDDGAATIRPRFFETDANQVTRLRGFGGKGFSEFHSQLVQGATKTVTNAVKIDKRIDFPLPEMARLILKVEKIAGSPDALEVAIQNDDGSGTAIGTDVAKATILAADLPAAIAEVTIEFPPHVVADQKPHVIIRATGATGVKVGVVSGGDDTPYAKAYYKFPVIVEVTAEASVISEYGYIDGEINNSQVTSRTEMLELVRSELARRKLPLKTAAIQPTDAAWLDADLGQTVSVTAPIVGETAQPWSITKLSHAFYGGGVWRLAAELSKVIAPPDIGSVLKQQDDRISRLERILVPTHDADVTRYLSDDDRGDASDAGTLTGAVAAFAWGTSKWAFAEWSG